LLHYWTSTAYAAVIAESKLQDRSSLELRHNQGMADAPRTLAGWLALVLVLAQAAHAGPGQVSRTTATVLSVGDGDTVRVRAAGREVTVRLACIDAPELRQVPYGVDARQRLRTLLPIGSSVEMRSKATDRYGRRVAELLRSGRNLNQELVGSGAAFVYWQYIAGCDRQTYGRLETEARLRGRGVWSVPGGITRPWDFRRGQPAAVIPDGTTPGGRRYRCKEIGSYARAQELLRQGHTYLDGNGDGEACESLR
jgi:endonuclease YncB( thermonuclease family)